MIQRENYIGQSKELSISKKYSNHVLTQLKNDFGDFSRVENHKENGWTEYHWDKMQNPS